MTSKPEADFPIADHAGTGSVTDYKGVCRSFGETSLAEVGGEYLGFENSGGRGSPCLSQRQLFRRYEDDDPKAVSHRKPAIEAAGYSAADEQQRRAEAEDWSEESDPAGGTEDRV